MTNPISTPAEMREAAARCCEAEADRCDDAAKWGGSKRYVSDCKAAAYAMLDRAAAIRALPVAEPAPVAVPLSDADREWIDARADELFRANERERGGVRGQTIIPQDFRDYFVATATQERILSQNVPAAQVRAEALREAARECDKLAGDPRMYGAERRRAAGQCAATIRAMIEKEPT